jgi:hypothetical protein
MSGKSSDEEDDYMSAAFLGESEAKGEKDTYSDRRKRAIVEQERKGKIAPLAVRQAEQRDMGLNQPIQEGNVGFRMLKAMGFKPGSALGRPETATAAKTLATPAHQKDEEDDEPARRGPKTDEHGRLLAPIGVEILNKGQGLGLQTATLKRAHEQSKLEANKRKRTEVEYKDVKRREFEERKARGEVAAMRREVEALDEKKGVPRSELWHEEPKPPQIDGGSGVGDYRTALSNEEILKLDEDGSGDGEEEPKFADLDPFSQRDLLISHLRTEHFFCHYCGVEYGSEEEMLAECPGEDADFHE